ncbi:Uncharacterized protein Adt_08792 [Abeliophyllum distichum]|uniref:Uncharacterized protein n=1 Tax=Abeliophyllum distichum TaxID=126358 RepID=A0ABD1UFC5_9LAMI
MKGLSESVGIDNFLELDRIQKSSSFGSSSSSPSMLNMPSIRVLLQMHHHQLIWVVLPLCHRGCNKSLLMYKIYHRWIRSMPRVTACRRRTLLRVTHPPAGNSPTTRWPPTTNRQSSFYLTFKEPMNCRNMNPSSLTTVDCMRWNEV